MSGCQMTSNQKHLREILGAKRVLVLQVITFFQKNKQLEKQNAMEDGCEIKKPQRGRPKKKDNCNGVCRVCQTNLKIEYGNAKSCINLFKPSLKSDTFGVVWAERLREVVGINVNSFPGFSRLACSVCARKIKNCCELVEFLSRRFGSEQIRNAVAVESGEELDCEGICASEGDKRKFSAVLSPARSSPQNRKSIRTHSPLKEKNTATTKKNSLHFHDGGFSRAVHSNVLSSCNVDDLDTSHGFAGVKVVICYPSGEVSVKSTIDDESQRVIKNISLKKWKTVANGLFLHEHLAPELKRVFSEEIARECKNYSSSDDSCLKYRSPDQLAVFSNKTLCKEVETHCPLLYEAMCNASNLTGLETGEGNERAVNAVALAVASLIRCRNPGMSAVAYRISTILFHSGVSYKDFGRLNHLGVCMSHDQMIALQQKMGENFDYKAMVWRKCIETNKCAEKLLLELKEKQVPDREEDDMDIAIEVDASEATLKTYEWYTPENYQRTVTQLDKSRQILNETNYNSDVIDEALNRLENEKLPLFKIVADNIDLTINARIQTKDHVNRSLHWTHQYAVLDKVANSSCNSMKPQKSISDLQFIDFLPDSLVQTNLVWQWAVLVSRVVTKYLPAFKVFRKNVIFHIPHKYVEEMAQKSETCSLGMEFHNPNVAAEMVEILKDYQSRYVPCFTKENKKEVVATVPVHGDQLFEERARNVEWAMRDGESNYDRLEGVPPEHADWHAKVTLYKTEFEMFVKDKSASEIGTSRASMNRTGKFNAAKGVQTNYNEYKDFHSREVEAHICVSFMEMCGMSKVDDKPSFEMPSNTSSDEMKSQWLLSLCKRHVEKYAVCSDVACLVEKTDELHQANQHQFQCRFEDCQRTFVFHSRRVRHELESHNLKLQVFDKDEQDFLGYFLCRNNCGLVFSTKSTRNRHERQVHPDFAAPEQPNQPDGDAKEDILFNYHQCKLAFGLILKGFEDAMKEGDGQRLFETYKLLLLIYKANKHPKYAYVTLHYLAKICAILPEFEAERLKWNRFINLYGGKACNIPFDLRKEHQNNLLKIMWKEVGPNLNEKSAARIAGTLDAVELILHNVDIDCTMSCRTAYRSVAKKEEAVYQMINDLLSIQAFKVVSGREGHPSFPDFNANLLHGLDYRQIHTWIKDTLHTWGSIYENNE